MRPLPWASCWEGLFAWFRSHGSGEGQTRHPVLKAASGPRSSSPGGCAGAGAQRGHPPAMAPCTGGPLGCPWGLGRSAQPDLHPRAHGLHRRQGPGPGPSWVSGYGSRLTCLPAPRADHPSCFNGISRPRSKGSSLCPRATERQTAVNRPGGEASFQARELGAKTRSCLASLQPPRRTRSQDVQNPTTDLQCPCRRRTRRSFLEALWVGGFKIYIFT